MPVKKKGTKIEDMLNNPNNYKPEEILQEIEKNQANLKDSLIHVNKFLRFMGEGYDKVYQKLIDLGIIDK